MAVLEVSGAVAALGQVRPPRVAFSVARYWPVVARPSAAFTVATRYATTRSASPLNKHTTTAHPSPPPSPTTSPRVRQQCKAFTIAHAQYAHARFAPTHHA